MKLRYDFHLHSCLSPCGDREMTPYNLVNMAALLGYDIIALTDHNTVGNCASAMCVGARAGITVIPGMELCTSEEIHVVCLFPGLQPARAFGDAVWDTLLPVRNKPHVFGEQLYMDDGDTVLGAEETLLVTASGISIEEVRGLVDAHGGFCYPAHIDRASFSVLSSFGVFPPELGFTCAEVTPGADLPALERQNPILKRMHLLRSSDAHFLENMPDPVRTLDLAENTPQAAVEYLKGLALQ